MRRRLVVLVYVAVGIAVWANAGLSLELYGRITEPTWLLVPSIAVACSEVIGATWYVVWVSGRA